MKTKFDYVSWNEVLKFTKDFAMRVKRDKKKYDVILAISRGGLIPGVILSHYLNIVNFNVVRIKSNKSEEPFSGKIKPIIKGLNIRALKNKKILLIDDIAGSGQTLIKLSCLLKRYGITNFDTFVLVKFRGVYTPPKKLKLSYFGKICRHWTIFPWEYYLINYQ